MTPEEAIKTIQVAIAEVEWEYPLDYSVAFETAIEALDKQIPKKPRYVDTRFRHHGRKTSDGSSLDECYECPNCNSHFFNAFDSEKCCKYCGQALDWSDDNA